MGGGALGALAPNSGRDDSLNIHGIFAYRVRLITAQNSASVIATARIHVHVHGKGQL